MVQGRKAWYSSSIYRVDENGEIYYVNADQRVYVDIAVKLRG